MQNKTKKGGARSGAGRPTGDEKVVSSFTLTPKVAEALSNYAHERRLSKSWVVEEALRQFLNIGG